ncbi:S41 family peptidase [Anthocerotibacter panamensis]|uniref:S41 family peptidase n=1 Tax=Anthocerotibacter panamensis TaxID=2857077 RepID=UPI001C405823|nr:S41 family peptidase [Anthocerotibacter panamensis]
MEFTRRAVMAGLLGTMYALPALAQASSGRDLDELLQLFRKVSLGERGTGIYLNREKLDRGLIVAQDVTYKGENPQTVEYRFLRDLVKKEGTPKDRFYDPSEVQQLVSAPQPKIESRSLQGDRVYIKIPQLEGSIADQVAQALHRYSYSQGIVLDLRGSDGDDAQALADMSRVFEPKTPVFATLLNKNQSQPHTSTSRTLAQGMPLVMLVDARTRGAAEALAGGLQLSGRARVLGVKTSGDSLRTAIYELPSGAAVRLVMGRWQTEGSATLSPVTPDLEVTQDPITRAINFLATQPPRTLETTVFPDQGRIGKYKLGFDAGTGDLGVPGLVEAIGQSEKRPLRPANDLKIWYLGDYTVFTYRPQGSLFTFYADRIYSLGSSTLTEKGIALGSTYAQVIAVYGGPNENGYVERFPFPIGSRGDTPERYVVDYDALGVSFLFESGTNRVAGIGLFKPGS